MPVIVDVVGVGEIEFPDSMSDTEIDQALKSRSWEQPQQPARITPPAGLFGFPNTPPPGSLAPINEPAPTWDQMIGRGFGTAGRLIWAGAVDALGQLVDPNQTAERRMEREVPGYIAPPSNLESVIHERMVKPLGGETEFNVMPEAYAGPQMPAESQLKYLGPHQQGFVRAGQGFVESTPRIGAMIGAQAVGVPLWAAGAGAFGFGEEGFSGKSATIGATLPFAGRWMGDAASLLMKRAGVSSIEAANAVRGLAHVGGPAGVLYADELHSINSMVANGTITEEEAEQSKLTALYNFGVNAGMSLPGLKRSQFEREPVRPPIIPRRPPGAPKLAPIEGYERLTELESSYLNAEREGMDQPMVVMEKPREVEGQPFARAKAEYVLRANKRTGQLEIYPGALQRWLESVPEPRRRSAMRRALNEEEVHFATDPGMALEYWRSLGGVQKAIVSKIYGGRFDGLDADGNKISEPELAFEALRLRVQQLSREGPREVAESALRERWTIKSLLALQDVINFFTESRDVKPGDRRAMIATVQNNLKAARAAVDTGEVPPGLAMRRRTQPELPFDEKAKSAFAMMRAAADNPDEVVPKAQLELWERAQEQGEPKPAVGQATIREQFRNKPGQLVMDLPPGERTQDASQIQQAAEVYGGVRPQPSAREGQVPTQEGGAGVQPQAEGRLLAGEEAFQRFSSGDQPVMSDASGEPVKVYHGTPSARVMGGIKTPAFFSDKPGTAKTYRGFKEERKPGDLYTRLGRTGNLIEGFIKFKNPMTWSEDRTIGVGEAKKIFQTTAHDAILNPKFNEFVIRDPEQAFIETVSPAMRRKGKDDKTPSLFELVKPKPPTPEETKPVIQPGYKPTRELQQGLDFEGRTGAPAPPEPTPVQTGLTFRQMTPQVLEDFTFNHLVEGDNPTFQGFTEAAGKRWDVRPEQLKQVWRENVWRGLMKASGDQLKSLLYRLNLGRAEKIKPGMSMLEVNAPRRGLRSGQSVGEIADPPEMEAEALAIEKALQYEARRGELQLGVPRVRAEQVLKNAIRRATSAKHRKQEYTMLMTEAKKAKARLNELGFEDINKNGELLKSGQGPGAINEESQGIARKLLAYRTRMDSLLEPERQAVGVTALVRERARLKKEIAISASARADILKKQLAVVENKIAQQQGGKVAEGSEQISPLAFPAGAPTKSAKLGPTVMRRLRVMAQIGVELLQQAETSETKLNRKTITPEDIAVQAGQSSVRRILPEEAGDLGLIGAIITSARQPDQATAVEKVVEGKKMTVKRQPVAEAATRNLVAVEEKHTGQVFLVSAYEGKGNVVRVMDPSSPSLKRAHTELSRYWLDRFKPLWSIEIDEPVRNFMQKFESKDALRRELLSPARQLLNDAAERQVIAEQTSVEKLDAERARVEELVAQGRLTQEGAEEYTAQLDVKQQEVERMEQFEDRPEFTVGKEGVARFAGPEAEPKIPQSLEEMRPIGQTLESRVVEPTIRSAAEIARENERRAAAGLKPLGAGLERVTGGTGQPEPVPLRKGSEKMGEEARRELRKRFPRRREYKGEIPDYAQANPELYKYMMSGWPKFESLGDRPVSEFDSPAMMRRLVKTSTDSIQYSLLDPTAGVLRNYSGWMSQRLRENGGVAANDFTDITEHIIDRTKMHEGKLFADYGDAALKAVGAPGPLGTMLNDFKVVNDRRAPNAAIGNAQGMVEGWRAVPGWAQAGVQLFRDANLAAGRLIETVIPGFMANGSWERHLTPLGYDVITAGSGPLWDSFIEGEAVANNRSKASVARLYRLLKKTLDDPMPEAGRLDRLNQEFKRLLPVAVTHVKVNNAGVFGGWKQVRHANAFNYLNATLKRAAHMTAFREQFPTGGLGRMVLDTFREQIANEPKPTPISSRGPNEGEIMENFDSLLRALQGHPTDQYGTSGMWGKGMFRPGEAQTEALRFVNNTVMNLAAKAVLTKQYITQVPELLAGATPSYLGYRAYIEGLARHRQLYSQMEHTGSVNRILYNWSVDPSAPIESIFRIAGNVISKAGAVNFLNEMQEAAAAATAQVTAERIQSGRLSNWEKRQLPITFKEMGFQPDQVRALMNGDQAMLDMFSRRAAAFLTSGNRHIAEGSRLGANRVFNSIFRFQSYPMMKHNQLRQDFRTLLDSRMGADRGVATERFARSLFMNTLQGALTAGIGAAVTSLVSPDIKWHEAKKNPMRFLLDSWFNAQSGPLYLVYNQASRTGLAGFGEQLGRMIFPWSIGREIVDYATGSGRYKYMDEKERTAAFMRSKLPGLGPVRYGLSLTGLSQDNPSLEASRAAFYKWQEKYYAEAGKPGVPKAKTKLDVQFRQKMDAAKKQLIRGEYEKHLESVFEATGMKTSEEVASSLRGRKVLKEGLSPRSEKPDFDAIEDLIETIGEKAYDELETHDLMLESAAQGAHPSGD